MRGVFVIELVVCSMFWLYSWCLFNVLVIELVVDCCFDLTLAFDCCFCLASVVIHCFCLPSTS